MPSPSQTSVIIVGPAVLTREAWTALLSTQPEIKVQAAFDNIDALKEFSPLEGPTTVLLDYPTVRLDIVRQAVSVAPGCGVVVFAHAHNHDDMVSLLQLGASGCVSRDDPLDHLARSITAAARGEIIIPSEHAPAVLASLAARDEEDTLPTEPLSEREIDVLRQIAKGLTNREAAEALFLSVRTVEAHLRSIYGKLGVSSRTEAVLWAVRNGYGPSR